MASRSGGRGGAGAGAGADAGKGKKQAGKGAADEHREDVLQAVVRSLYHFPETP